MSGVLFKSLQRLPAVTIMTMCRQLELNTSSQNESEVLLAFLKRIELAPVAEREVLLARLGSTLFDFISASLDHSARMFFCNVEFFVEFRCT